MTVRVMALVAPLIVIGLTFPLHATDYRVTVPGWELMLKDDQDKTRRDLEKKYGVKKGKDKIIIVPAPLKEGEYRNLVDWFQRAADALSE